MFKSVNVCKDFMGRIYPFSGGKYIGIQLLQIIKKIRTLLMSVFKLERRGRVKF